MLAGVRGVRVGQLFPRLRDLAVDPARARPRGRSRPRHGTSASTPSSRRPASRRVRGVGGRPRGDEVHREPGDQQHDAISSSSAPSSWPASARAASGTLSVVRRVARERPRDHRAPRPRAAAEQRQRAAQPQRHDREPERQADQRARAARRASRRASAHVEQQAERRPGERVDRRRGPSAARPATAAAARPARPSARPRSSSRTARAAARSVSSRASAPGKTLVSSAHAAHDHAAERDAVEHRRPAAGREPHERERAGERRQVGERAVGLQPRVGGRRATR